MLGFADLPVSVDLPGRLGAEVAAFAEAEAGWQVIGGDGPLLPALVLGARVEPGRPCVVITESIAPAELREALQAGALDVIVWPAEKERLLRVPDRLAGPPTGGPATPLLRIAGCRGGVGTSTVALTVGAAVAWAGGRALCVGRDGMVQLTGIGPWTGPGFAELVALGEQGGPEAPAVARAVPGVPDLWVLGGDGPLPARVSWPYDVVVVDVGASPGAACEIMVGAADATVARASETPVVLVVEHGPLDRGAVADRLGRTPDAYLPFSRRVARAGSAGRVPSSLPGSWVSAVRRGLAGAVR